MEPGTEDKLKLVKLVGKTGNWLFFFLTCSGCKIREHREIANKLFDKKNEKWILEILHEVKSRAI